MTRLGHLLTILTTAFPLVVTGSAFAQTIEIAPVEIPQVEIPRVEVPRVVIPRIDIPRIEIPPIEPFEFSFDIQEQLERARAMADLAQTVDVGRFAQLTDEQRAQVDAARDKAREAIEHAKEMSHEGMRYALQGPQAKNRVWERCNERDADRLYDCGRDALDDKQWDRAVDFFGKVAAAKSERADAALYWKAYAQNKLGQRAEALTTIAQFKSAYAKSR